VIVHIDVQNIVLKTKGDHCHLPELEHIQIRTFEQIVKEPAINEITPILQIYDKESARIVLTVLSIVASPSEREIGR
jgi:hypothetical protein